jgi:RNA chaperone Hfq
MEFVSQVLTGTGSEQAIPHSIGQPPRAIAVVPTDLTVATGPWSVVEGGHTATELKLTVTSGAKYRVYAWRWSHEEKTPAESPVFVKETRRMREVVRSFPPKPRPPGKLELASKPRQDQNAVQGPYLTALVGRTVKVRFLDGKTLTGTLRGHDTFALRLETDGQELLIYKHFIGYVVPVLAGQT